MNIKSFTWLDEKTIKNYESIKWHKPQIKCSFCDKVFQYHPPTGSMIGWYEEDGKNYMLAACSKDLDKQNYILRLLRYNKTI